MNHELQSIAACGGSANHPDNGGLFDIREDIGYLLTRAYRYVVSVGSEEFAKHGITHPQFIVLMHIDTFKTDSQISLSHTTGIDRATIAGIIDRLEQKGVVARTATAEDRRVRQIVLTESGLRLKGDLCIAAEKIRSRLMNKIPSIEFAELGMLLKKLCER